MEEVRFSTVQEFNDYYGLETLHPQVTVVRYDRERTLHEATYHYGLYALFLKENKGCKLSYGRRYEFFDYTSNEALHLSAGEIEIFREVLSMIQQELQHNIDKHTRELIVSNIELLLNYCLRFYDRQFVTREEINHTVVKKFTTLLDEYIEKKAAAEGLPSVGYFAEKCCYSAGYFGELVKTETGRNAKDFINDRLLRAAKQLLADESLNITNVSERLGFEYPQHFVRFFKARTGMTPSQFRKTA